MHPLEILCSCFIEEIIGRKRKSGFYIISYMKTIFYSRNYINIIKETSFQGKYVNTNAVCLKEI